MKTRLTAIDTATETVFDTIAKVCEDFDDEATGEVLAEIAAGVKAARRWNADNARKAVAA